MGYGFLPILFLAVVSNLISSWSFYTHGIEFVTSLVKSLQWRDVFPSSCIQSEPGALLTICIRKLDAKTMNIIHQLPACLDFPTLLLAEACGNVRKRPRKHTWHASWPWKNRYYLMLMASSQVGNALNLMIYSANQMKHFLAIRMLCVRLVSSEHFVLKWTGAQWTFLFAHLEAPLYTCLCSTAPFWILVLAKFNIATRGKRSLMSTRLRSCFLSVHWILEAEQWRPCAH